MNFFSRKNLTEREEFLYIPVIHWMYVVKPLIGYLIILLGLFITCHKFSVFDFLNNNSTSKFFYIAIIWFCFFTLEFTYRMLRYRSIKYGVTNKRLIIKKGIITTKTIEIPIDRIESINSRQGLFGSLFNYGNIIINGIGCKNMVFYMVLKPYALRRKVIEIIEKGKLITVIHGNIPKYVRPEKPKPKPIDDTYLWGNFVKVS